MDITVVTGNPNKVLEVASFFEGVADVVHVKMDLEEIKSSDVGVVAEKKAETAYEIMKKPLIVDDTGFYIQKLNGFPGAHAAYVLDTIGVEGILKLMDGITDRSSYFETAIAYADNEGVFVFKGRVDGNVALKPRGSEGFGYDPVFETGGKTFAEISVSEKSKTSHRGRALSAFRDWYLKNRA
ncbi:XTP/dITP diphosphohydrolase [Methanomicrobium sp. W14]|uniref:RdgB/HAM1 family non-canonical purine NTP pyrophosphatase n=1 Tax=Methanomicrobium sp. W14 TaxID=2817839 RepID=UPI001AE94BF7|nr:RdgB/HAM1 family non-canonical purine NTP pyrophosphatase [Methanomicrobium sp. W14]MBP2133383.1 XTP/dITP diphosphohydrolase [Methanomicrobium sp. W14]